ncbi:MEDS domain-containing protein [Natronococcus roseus]|uniref:MEDS domain-containing protein n=1 Tax=Natronococcus roseus TaxID=1052014 RepID=UPI00374DF68E
MEQTGAPSRELDHGLGDQLVTPIRMDEVSDSHEHLASIYRTRDQQFEAAIPFVRTGLERGERCLYIAGETGREEVLEAMAGRGIDVERALESGALSIHTPTEVYGGTEREFDADDVLAFLESTVDSVTREGYEALRITAEMSWILEGWADLDQVIAYERAVNRFYTDRDAIALCQYDRHAFPDDFLTTVIENHPHIVYDGTVGGNVFYAPPEEFEPTGTSREVDRKLQTIASRAETRSRLEHRDRGLTRLTTATRKLMRADADEIHGCATEVVREVLGVPRADVWLYDSELGTLRPADRTRDRSGSTARSAVEDPLWEAFVDRECRTLEDGGDDPTAGGSVAAPLGKHGVLRAEADTAGAFDDVSMDLLQTIAANVEAAYDRAERETQLREQTDRLERLERINGVIRSIDRGVVRANSRDEIERVVCASLARSDAYAFAWIGEPSLEAGRVEPLEWAGAGSDYLNELAGTVDDRLEATPAGRAADAGSVRIVDDVVTDRSFDAWRSIAIEHGFRSCVSVPITYEDTLYSVLSVYATDSAMTGLDQEVLAELGELIGDAIHNTETETALGSATVTELDLAIDGTETVLSRLARETACGIDVEGYVPAAETDRLFVTVRDDDADRIADAAAELVGVDRVRRITSHNDESRFELSVTAPSVAAAVVERGGKIQSIEIDETDTGVTVELPPSADVRDFVDELQRAFPGTRLVARRSRERPDPASVRNSLEERLTDRQREVLQTAYLSGYFESPRRSTGQEVTESLGVSHPTFAQHLRAAQRKLCDSLFE